MLDVKQANSGVVASIADDDLILCHNGQWSPISFANLMKAVQKAGNFRLDTPMSPPAVKGDWVRVAKTKGNQFYGILAVGCSYNSQSAPVASFIALGGYNASYGKLKAYWINKDESMVSAVRFIKDGDICHIEVKFNHEKTNNFYVTLSNNFNMALVPASISNATDPITEVNWGGVIGLLPITYDSERKGGAHDDQGTGRSAGLGADCHLAFESIDDVCRFIGESLEGCTVEDERGADAGYWGLCDRLQRGDDCRIVCTKRFGEPIERTRRREYGNRDARGFQPRRLIGSAISTGDIKRRRSVCANTLLRGVESLENPSVAERKEVAYAD